MVVNIAGTVEVRRPNILPKGCNYSPIVCEDAGRRPGQHLFVKVPGIRQNDYTIISKLKQGEIQSQDLVSDTCLSGDKNYD